MHQPWQIAWCVHASAHRVLRYNEKKDRIEAARAAQIFADEDVDNTSEDR